MKLTVWTSKNWITHITNGFDSICSNEVVWYPYTYVDKYENFLSKLVYGMEKLMKPTDGSLELSLKILVHSFNFSPDNINVLKKN